MGTDKPKIQGEGDYASARTYDEAAKRFVEEGRVAPAARAARTDDPARNAELEQAERAGRARAKEEDRLLDPRAGEPTRVLPQDERPGTPPGEGPGTQDGERPAGSGEGARRGSA